MLLLEEGELFFEGDSGLGEGGFDRGLFALEGEGAGFGDDVGGLALARLPPHQPVAKDILFGDNRQAWGGKALLDAVYSENAADSE